jgi:hypothetical protein
MCGLRVGVSPCAGFGSVSPCAGFSGEAKLRLPKGKALLYIRGPPAQYINSVSAVSPTPVAVRHDFEGKYVIPSRSRTSFKRLVIISLAVLNVSTSRVEASPLTAVFRLCGGVVDLCGGGSRLHSLPLWWCWFALGGGQPWPNCVKQTFEFPWIQVVWTRGPLVGPTILS